MRQLSGPSLWRPSRLEAAGLIAALLVWLGVVLMAEPFGRLWGTGQEAHSYWNPTLTSPYDHADWTTTSAYVYSPAFLQVVEPIAVLPWQAFMAIWTALLLATLRFLTGPKLLLAGVLLALIEIPGGNISLLLAAAMVVGFRWPAAWAFVLLTKITPGIGLLWFLVRREWRSLAIAFGATVAVAAISILLMPAAWAEWLEVLSRIAGRNGTWAAIPIPLVVRAPVAVALVVWGARTDRRWTVPVAGMIALPALWYGGLTMLLATIALNRSPWSGRVPAEARIEPLEHGEIAPPRAGATAGAA